MKRPPGWEPGSMRFPISFSNVREAHSRIMFYPKLTWLQLKMISLSVYQSICEATSPSKSFTHSHVISVCIEFLVGQLQHIGLNRPRRNGRPEGAGTAGSFVGAVQEQLESHLSVMGSDPLFLRKKTSTEIWTVSTSLVVVSNTTDRPHLETSKQSH